MLPQSGPSTDSSNKPSQTPSTSPSCKTFPRDPLFDTLDGLRRLGASVQAVEASARTQTGHEEGGIIPAPFDGVSDQDSDSEGEDEDEEEESAQGPSTVSEEKSPEEEQKETDEWKKVDLKRKQMSSGVIPDHDITNLPFFKGGNVGAKNIPKTCKTPWDFLKLFYTDEVMDEFVKNTNAYELKDHPSWRQTDREEIWRLFGIFLYMGVVRQPTIDSYWTIVTSEKGELFHRHLVANAMSRDRFYELALALHFVDTGASNKKLEDFDLVDPFLRRLSESFKRYYNCDQYIDIDEMCFLFKGRHKCRFYNAKKPN